MTAQVEVPFPVMTDAGFPHGLRCAECHRLIGVGQPYREDLEGMVGDSPLTVLRCVYCPAGEG